MLLYRNRETFHYQLNGQLTDLINCKPICQHVPFLVILYEIVVIGLNGLG